MISYCITCYRPRYATLLIDDLVRKTSVPFEILLWLNVDDQEFEHWLHQKQIGGYPIRIVARTPHNIGMAAYFHLFDASRFDMVTQIDDDVVCVSPRIAETASEIFARCHDVGMLAADVWQDEYTTGARPPLEQYRIADRERGLYDGPIDGWFAIYRKSCLHLCRKIERGRYVYIGGRMQGLLRENGLRGLLCTGMKVFHVMGPQYVSYFGMLDFEIAKYAGVGRTDMVRWYSEARNSLPSYEELHRRVQAIRSSLEGFSIDNDNAKGPSKSVIGDG